MSGFKLDNFNDRRTAAAKAKEALLEKFRAGKQVPAAGDTATPSDATPSDATPAGGTPAGVAEGKEGPSAAGKARPR